MVIAQGFLWSSVRYGHNPEVHVDLHVHMAF